MAEFLTGLAIDEDVHIDIAKYLKDAGYDISLAKDNGLAGKPDEDILSWAVQNKRIFITGDKDFGELLHLKVVPEGGKVILLRYTFIDPSYIANDIIAVLQTHKGNFTRASSLLCVLSEGQQRFHIFRL